MTAEPDHPEQPPTGLRAYEHITALMAISREMHAGLDPKQTCDLIGREAARFMGADRVAVLWRDPDTNRLACMAATGISPAYLAAVDRYYEQSAGGLASRMGRPLVIRDTAIDPRVAPELRLAAVREGFVAQMILPLAQGGEVLGGLTLYWNRADVAALDATDLANLFADQATVALANAHAFEIARRRGDVATDLAEQRLVELSEATLALNKALEEVMQVERLKGDFLGAVSHELRTPLTAMLGFAEFLEEGLAGPLNPGQQRYLDQILVATHQLMALVDDLLDFARLEAGRVRMDRRPMPLGPLLGEVVHHMESTANNGRVVLSVDSPADLPEVLADPERVRQICANLVGNAIKFTPAGGNVAVRAAEGPEGVRIEVLDTGVGFNPENSTRLFEKFYREDNGLTRTTKGTGLGLAIARQLVEAHGGQIGVDGRPGGGSVFWFTLPTAG